MTIEVLDPGPLVHAAGPRPARAGPTSASPRAGALDRGAAALARRLVGGDADDAVVETTLGGVVLRDAAAP